jgi:PAS domain S-box-containing protein
MLLLVQEHGLSQYLIPILALALLAQAFALLIVLRSLAKPVPHNPTAQSRKDLPKCSGDSEPAITSLLHVNPLPACLSTLDEGRFVGVNDAWVRLFGYSSEEVIGRTSLDLDIWVQPAKCAELLSQLNAGRSVRDYECQIRLKSDAVRDVLVAAEVIEFKATRCSLSLIHDITELRRAEEAMRRQTAYLEALHQVTLGVVSELNVDDLLEKSLERAVSLIGAAYAWLYLVTPEQDAIELKVGTGTLSRFRGTRLKKGEGLSGRIWETGESVVVENYQSWQGRSGIFEGELIGPAMGMPLKWSGQVIGVIGLTCPATDTPFTDDERALMTRFANLAEIALKNARLHTSLQTELSERARAEQALQERLAFERLITNISTEFINLSSDQIDPGITRALQSIGEFTGSDRSYVYMFSEDGVRMDNLHEWCRTGILSLQSLYRDQPADLLPWTTDQIKRGQVVHVPVFNDLPSEAQKDRAQMQSHSDPPLSYINVPMIYRGRVIGLLGFDAVRTEKEWSEDSTALLRIVGEIFVNALEHKRASDALRRSEMRFRTMFENAGIAIGIKGMDEDSIQSNPATRRLLGYSEEEFAHLDSPDYTYPEDYPAQKMLENEMMAGRRDGYQLEKRYIRKDGQVVWGRLIGSVVRDTTGKVLYVIAMTQDITEQKLAAQKLAEVNQTLEQRVAERTHELATLNAIAARVSGSLNLNEIMADALERMMELTGMEHGVAYRIAGGEDGTPSAEPVHLHVMAFRGLPPDFADLGDGLPLSQSAAGVAGRRGEPMIWTLAELPSESTLKRRLASQKIEQVIAIPLMAKGRLVGSLNLSTNESRTYPPEQIALLNAIGQQVGVAVENARLYEQAERSAQAAERSRLARELHDSVTQSLYSINLYAEATARLLTRGRHDEAVVRLRDLRDTAQEALREMRLLIFELRPLALEKGLAAALQTRLDTVESRCGVRAHLQVDGKEDLVLDMQAELYHIALEALNNALKHARAQSVHVQLLWNKAMVCLQIRDDGAGFETATMGKRGGFGISGMRERARRIGGTLEITSAPGQGTSVTVQVPMGTCETED